jgi:hypothetical protein
MFKKISSTLNFFLKAQSSKPLNKKPFHYLTLRKTACMCWQADLYSDKPVSKMRELFFVLRTVRVLLKAIKTHLEDFSIKQKKKDFRTSHAAKI